MRTFIISILTIMSVLYSSNPIWANTKDTLFYEVHVIDENGKPIPNIQISFTTSPVSIDSNGEIIYKTGGAPLIHPVSNSLLDKQRLPITNVQGVVKFYLLPSLKGKFMIEFNARKTKKTGALKTLSTWGGERVFIDIPEKGYKSTPNTQKITIKTKTRIIEQPA